MFFRTHNFHNHSCILVACQGKVWSVFWACTISRAAVNVQLHNVAVVGKKCASGGNVFKFDTKPSLLKFHRTIEVPLAAATSVRAWMCLKVVSGERCFRQLTKATLAERTISKATATFFVCCNFSGDAVDTFLKTCFSERTISTTTAAF